MELVASNHPALRKKSLQIVKDEFDVEAFSNEMFSIVESKGIGLAAPQLGVNVRLFVVNLLGEKRVFINPKIVKKYGVLSSKEEGCLSLPNIFVKVARHSKVFVEYYDLNWNKRKEVFSDTLARVIQHEQDHLNGKLIIDYI